MNDIYFTSKHVAHSLVQRNSKANPNLSEVNMGLLLGVAELSQMENHQLILLLIRPGL